MIKLIITDDHKMFRESLVNIFSTKKIAEVIGEAGNGLELLELLNSKKPDILLMDIAMPIMDGIEATKKALIIQPNLKILVLSSFDDDKYYFSMVEAGVKGFVLKNSGINELKNAITEVSQGNSWFSTELIQKLLIKINESPKKKPSKNDLSERETEVLKYICESLTNEQIAEKMHISFETVKWHRTNIMSKTGCTNTAGLVIYAIKSKIIQV